MKIITFIFLFLNINSEASLKPLLNEYLKNNFVLKQSEVDYHSSLLDQQILSASKTFYLSYTGSLVDDNTKSSFTFKANPSQTKNHTLAVNKLFNFGTSVTFEQNLQNYSGTSALGQSVPETFGAYQRLSITQDLGQNFLGKEFHLQEKILKERSELSKINYDLNREVGVLEFSSSYFMTAYLKELLGLRLEAVKRANTRLKLVGRRVRDGLAEKTDFWRAKSALIESRSTEEETRLQYQAQVVALMEKLQRKFNGEEISRLEMNSIEINDKDVKNNKELQLYLIKLKLTKMALKKSRNGHLPKINLSFSYLNNDYSTVAASEAFKNGAIGSNQNSKTLALTVSWPIGNEVQKIKVEQSFIFKEQADFSLKMRQKIVSFKKRQIIQSIKTYQKKVDFQKVRRTLAKKILRDLNKMYGKGKVDFDQVIRAEEGLIQTESSYYQSVFDYKNATLNLFLIYGELETNILNGVI